MGTTYELAGPEVMAIIAKMIDRYHMELAAQHVAIDVLMATNKDGDAIRVGGYPANASIKIIGLKDRAKGHGDAEMLIDSQWWEDATQMARDALIDHELYHLEVKTDKQNHPVTDDLGRPSLLMRKHDYQFGWFNAIASRHGEHSTEVYQATNLFDESGQTYFRFAMEKPVKANERGVKHYMTLAQ